MAVNLLLVRSSPSLLGLAGFPIGIITGWLTWSLLTPQWRLWAYERVENLEELKQLAVANSITWPAGHFFERTEILSAQQKQRLHALDRRATRN